MYPSRSTSSCEMSVSPSQFALGYSNANSIASDFYPNLVSRSSSSSPHYMDLVRSWNYHQFLTSSSSLSSLPTPQPTPTTKAAAVASYKTNSLSDKTVSNQPRLQDKSLSSQQTDEQYPLGKFHHETLVHLDTGESKSIQQITAKDFLDSAKLSSHYSR